MTELEIISIIKDTLIDHFDDFNVDDFPSNINDYFPYHPNGELLIKALGYKNDYILKDRSYDKLDWGSIIMKEHNFRIDLILRELRSQNEIISITDKIINVVTNIEFDGFGKIYHIDASEIDFELEKQFQFRSLNFVYPQMEIK